MSAKAFAELYKRQGWRIVPIPHGSKNPNTKDWPNREFEPKHITQNVGVILGPVSGGLVDVDLDSTDALALAPYFLPETLTFGRESKPASHWLFKCTGVRSDKLWFGEGKAGSKKRELIEIRAQNASGDGCGHQTVFPGSVHESGEAIEFDNALEPTEIDAGELIWAVAKLATASTIAKGWTSGRHEKSLAITGGLLKAGWTAEEVRDTMAAVRECCGDSDAEEADFGHDVESTITKAEAEGVDVLAGFGSLVQSGVMAEWEAKALERHSRTPATRKREAGLARTKVGRGMLEAMVAHAHAVDGLEAVGDAVAKAAAPVAKPAPKELEGATDDQPLEHLGVIADLSTDPEPIAYLIEGIGLGPGKVSTINGYAGTAKGLLLSLIALCVASGTDFLGMPVKRARVLYIDAETGRLAQTRIKRIARGLGLDVAELQAKGWLTFIEARPPVDEDFLTELEFVIGAARIGLVCADSYTSLVGGDQNESTFSDVAFRIGNMSNAKQFTALVVSHARKQSTGAKRSTGIEMIAGTQSLGAAFQGSIAVTRPSESETTLLEIHCQRSPDEGFAPFRIQWSDISDPEPPPPQKLSERIAGAGKLRPEKWGLQCELVPMPSGKVPERSLEDAAAEVDLKSRIRAFLKRVGSATQRAVREGVSGRAATIREALIGMAEDPGSGVETINVSGHVEYRLQGK
jgi:hypothetical protein